MSNSTHLTKGYVIAFIATAIWSTTAIFIRYLNVHYGLPPLVLAFWRDLFACLAMALITLVFRPRRLSPRPDQLRFLIFYGLVLTLFNATWTISVFFNGAAVSTVLAYSSGAFTAVLGWRFLREHLDGFKILAVLLSLAGCLLVSGAYQPAMWQINTLGVITGLVSGLMMALYSLMGRWATLKDIHPLTSLTYTFGFAAGFLLLINFIPLPAGVLNGDLFALGSSLSGWLVLILLAIGPTIGGYGLYTTSLVYLPASVANLIATLEPGFTAIIAYFTLAEKLTAVQLAGSALILSGVLFLRWSEGRRSRLAALSQGTPPAPSLET